MQCGQNDRAGVLILEAKGVDLGNGATDLRWALLAADASVRSAYLGNVWAEG
jgi:hypothetical protein